MTSSWGTTETSPLATAAHFIIDRAGPIGVPVPGVELKLVPAGDKLEVRVRGPNVTPGYWKRPDLTAAAFDEDGFYKPGDAVRFADPADPAQGHRVRRPPGRGLQAHDRNLGRMSARCGSARSRPPRRCCRTPIVAGENREFIGVLAWLNAAGCHKLIGAERSAARACLPSRRARACRPAIAQWNAEHRGSSERIARVLLLPDAPSIDANEITDKGYINQRLALERRTADVERLFAARRRMRDVIVVGRPELPLIV